MTDLQAIEIEFQLLHKRVCPALGDPTRMLILYLLQESPLNVGEITRRLHMPQSSVSRHLAVLRERNLVSATRNGNSVTYSLVNAKIIEVIDALRDLLKDQISSQSALLSNDQEQ